MRFSIALSKEWMRSIHGESINHVQSQQPSGRSAQTRRDLPIGAASILGAPRFSPHRIGGHKMAKLQSPEKGACFFLASGVRNRPFKSSLRNRGVLPVLVAVSLFRGCALRAVSTVRRGGSPYQCGNQSSHRLLAIGYWRSATRRVAAIHAQYRTHAH
jgi:hypothetical protein